jgi:hypothetical protein
MLWSPQKTVQRFWDDKPRTNLEVKFTHEQGAELLQESWLLGTREKFEMD